ncbi:MAG: adenylate/guanylate cyclase domain-containing protein [Desulfatibacillaceae bacterium]|nr:adenylate/guanylate cyclase domain-containing protein [Desulfatibacillaceae bacterium]
MREFLRRIFKVNALFITIFVVLVVCGAYLSKVFFLEVMDLKTLDLRFEFRGAKEPGPEVLLAVIDERSLAEQGKWVWPRSKIAELINALSDAGAAAIGLDIGFLEPDPASTSLAIGQVEEELARRKMLDKELFAQLENIRAAGDYDTILAQAIKNSKAPVALGFFFQMSREGVGGVDDQTLAMQLANASGARYQVIHETQKGKDFAGLPFAFMPQANIELLASSTDYSGYFNMFPDSDGTVRWMPMVIKCQDEFFAPLALSTLRAYLGEDIVLSVDEFGVRNLRLGRTNLPVNETGHLLINYFGPGRTFPHISVTDILEGRVEKERLNGKIVLVGATAVGIFDLRVTPFDKIFPGLEIHANVLENILRNDFVTKPNWVAIIDLAAILLFGAVLGFLLPRLKVFSGGMLVLGLLIFTAILAQVAFSSFGLAVSLVYPVLVILLLYLGLTIYKYVTEEAEKRFLKGAFSTYLAPSVVAEIMKDPQMLALGGEEREITAFFSDVAGFTSISERLTPNELVQLLNEFLTDMTDIILEEQGTVDKFEGDAIIAFFGAPLEMPDHAARACVACVKMQERLARLREKFAAENRPILHMRIGMNTGLAVVGNMGSATRMDYTMMGDTVNTAARLEGVNKIYGTYTMVSEATYDQARHAVAARELDAVNVVGKKEPVKIFEILGLPGKVDPKQTEVNRHYAKGLADYRQRRFDEAMISFSAALATLPEDGPSKVMFARCQEYRKKPPPADWNGAYTMTSK